MEVVSVLELLVIEFAFPKNSQLYPAVCKNADKSDKARLRDKPKGKLDRADNADEHPCNSTDNEDNGGSDEVKVGAATGIESAKIGEEHPRKHN